MDIKNCKIRPLSEEEAIRSREANGENRLTRRKVKSFFKRFIENLNDPVIRILICALAVNTFFAFKNGSFAESIGMAIAIFLATFISSYSEHSSQRAFSKLEKGDSEWLCRVIRKEGKREIPITEVAVGDIVMLSAGENICADGILVSGAITVDQASLTGESREKEKTPGDSSAFDPENRSALFRGSAVLSGEGQLLVTSVGDKTFLGEISSEIQMETRESPLRFRLTKLAKQISIFGYISAFFVAVAYLFNCFIIDSGFETGAIILKLTNVPYLLSKLAMAFTLGLTVIVMALPEGLPMMIAVVLSANLRRMVADNVLVRKPVGIEAAGSMNVLFTDKTGTLTEGKVRTGRMIFGDLSLFNSSKDFFKDRDTKASEIFLLSCVYNTSSFMANGRASGGNETDRALLDAVKGINVPKNYKVVKRLPFDSKNKFSTVTLCGSENLELIKGAPERIIPLVDYCLLPDGDISHFDKKVFSDKLLSLTSSGTRIIAVAYRKGKNEPYTLLCALELCDRIRKNATESVEKLKNAGVQVVMITGDNKNTAEFIAKSCGIVSREHSVCLTSDELAKLSDAKLASILPRLAVVARALPTDKSRLVRVAQESGCVVGMTGDGVNDAPALRHADVGFAMGSGSQVAKDAGDIVILDNNLASIVKAVLYGRTVFVNIRKFITLQLLMNMCACGVSMIGPFVNVDAPVTVVQMLWINLIMDTLGGLAFAGDAPCERYMKEKPKRRDEPILNGYMLNCLIFQGGFTLALSIVFLKFAPIVSSFRAYTGNLCLLSAFFAFFVFSSVFNCFNMRSDRLNLFTGLSKNKIFLCIMAAISVMQVIFICYGGALLRTMPLTIYEWGLTLLISFAVIPADFIRKLLFRLLGGKKGY